MNTLPDVCRPNVFRPKDVGRWKKVGNKSAEVLTTDPQKKQIFAKTPQPRPAVNWHRFQLDRNFIFPVLDSSVPGKGRCRLSTNSSARSRDFGANGKNSNDENEVGQEQGSML